MIAPDVAAELQKPKSRAIAVSEAATGKTPGQVEEDDFSAWFVKEGRKLLETPEIFVRAARAKFGGGSEVEQAADEQTLKGARSPRAQEIRDMNPMQLVEKLATPGSDLKFADINALLGQGEKAGFDAALRIYQQERDIANRQLIASSRASSDPAYASALIASRDAFKASGGVGTLNGWYYILTGGDTRRGTPPKQEIDAINTSLESRQQTVAVGQQIKARQAIDPLIQAIHKGGTETIQRFRVDKINDALRSIDSPWEAYWDTEYINELMFRNKQSGVVTRDYSNVYSELPPTDPQPPPIELNPQEQATAQWLKSLTQTQRERQIAKLRQAAATAGSAARAEAIIQSAGF
jgi:hypothetical protein